MKDSYPRLLIDLNKIQKNALNVVELCAKYKINVNGVTKATLGDPKIAEAMLKGGATFICDSRIENIKKMCQANIQAPFILLRSPMLSEVEEVVKWADASLNSEIRVIEALGKNSLKQNKSHKVIAMVEMGDLREGVLPADLDGFIDKVLRIQGVELYGLGMNLTCYGAIIPTQEKIDEFTKIVRQIEKKKNIKFKMVSGGNSSAIPLLTDHFNNACITDLRLGESILLGRETAKRHLIKGSYPDAFILECEIIELKEKPSIPSGIVGEDAFGQVPKFEDHGVIKRALAAIGHQDIGGLDIEAIDPDVAILGASSDHLILHIKSGNYAVGDKLSFNLKYGSLLHIYTSPFVKKVYV